MSAIDPFLNGEWVRVLVNYTKVPNALTVINNHIWVCGEHTAYGGDAAQCTLLLALSGKSQLQLPFPWNQVTSTAQGSGMSTISLSGLTDRSGILSAELAICDLRDTQLSCTARSFADTKIAAVSYTPAVDKMVYVGDYKAQALVMIVDSLPSAVTRSYLYSSPAMKPIVFSHIQSPPNYIGSFIAGTCANSGSINYIFAGMMRTDSGAMTAMYVAPMTGNILNSAELVNAMALEYVKPDSFIAGGLQLNDGTGMHAYLLCANSIYRRVVYGMRYVLHSTGSGGRRRALLDGSFDGEASAVKGMVRVDSILYLLVNYKGLQSQGSVLVLKADMATGNVLQQVQIYSHYADIQCSSLVVSGLSLVTTCTVTSSGNVTKALLLSVNRELTFSQLPVGFRKYENETFVEKQETFRRTFLSMSAKLFVRTSTEYSFSAAEVSPTFRPSVVPTPQPSSQPSSAPSGQPSSSPTSAPSVSPQPSSQPSSSPTSAPSVSPQPTSQPSSSGPTNTYKPTVKPTPRPSTVPSKEPTVQPTMKPTLKPSVTPSTKPSLIPSTQPSLASTVASTSTPTARPTRKPSTHLSVVPTHSPTSAPSAVVVEAAAIGNARRKADNAVMIFVYVVVGVTGIWCMYQLLKCCARTEKDVQRKLKLRTELKHIRLTMLDEAPRRSPVQLPENRPIGAFANGTNIDSGEGNATRSTRTRGAYATGIPVAPASVGSDGSSSLVLSSLHSSEMSDISYNSVYSTEFTKSSENVMEEGGGNNSQESSRSGSGDDTRSNYDSEHSDGQSNNIDSEDTMDKLSPESSIRSSEGAGSISNISDSQGSVEHSDLDESEAHSVNK